MIYKPFATLMESVVLPLQTAHPTHIRLDGEKTGGNWMVAGRFSHQNKDWKIHADTHYEPLVLAYRAVKERGTYDPFVEEPTPKGNCLVLKAELRVQMKNPKFKHMYIYEENA